MKQTYRSYILLAYMSLFVQGLSDNIRGPLFPDLLDYFHLDNRTGSLFFSLSSAMGILGGYLGGHSLDQFGRVRTMRAATLLMFLSLLGVGLAPSFPWILSAIFFFGLSCGSLGVAQNVMVIEAGTPAEVQKFQAGLQSMYGLSSLSAPLLVSLMHTLGYAWQTSFFWAGGLSLALFAVSFRISEMPVRSHHQKIPGGEAPSREISYFALLLACYVAAEILVSSRLAQFLREVLSWDVASTGILNSLFFVGMFTGRVLFIFWRPKMSLKTQMGICLGLTAVCIAAGVLLHPLALAASGLAMAPFYPLCMTMAGRLFPRDLSRVTAQSIALSGVMIVIMQTLVGFIADHYGLRLSLLLGPVLALISLLMIFSYQALFRRSMNSHA